MNAPATDSAPFTAPDTLSDTNTATWLVYLLECADASLYCGITNNMTRRLDQHNGLVPGGARYTRGRRPVRLLGCRTCGCKSEALRLERAVKSRARTHKLHFLLSGELA